MKKILQTVFVTLAVGVSLVPALQAAYVPPASAQLFSGAKQEACKGTQLSGSGGNCLPGQASRLNTIIATAINILSLVVAIAAVIMLIINGLRFVTSGGDSNAVSNAKRGVLYAIVGLVLVALAQLIVRYVLNAAT